MKANVHSKRKKKEKEMKDSQKKRKKKYFRSVNEKQTFHESTLRHSPVYEKVFLISFSAMQLFGNSIFSVNTGRARSAVMITGPASTIPQEFVHAPADCLLQPHNGL